MEIILQPGSQAFRKIFMGHEKAIMQSKGFPGYYILIFLLVPALLAVAPFFIYTHAFIFVASMVVFPFWVYHLVTSSKVLYGHFRRKRLLNRYCKYLDSIKTAKIKYDDTYFELTIDGKTDVLKWEAFKEITLNDDYLELKTEQSNYFFPKGNMEIQEFESLSSFVQTKIKSA